MLTSEEDTVNDMEFTLAVLLILCIFIGIPIIIGLAIGSTLLIIDRRIRRGKTVSPSVTESSTATDNNP
jgi:hypothetical protein